MGKKKDKNKKQPNRVTWTPPSLSISPQAAAALGMIPRRALRDITDYLEQSPLVGPLRVTQCSRACCDAGDRDAVIVAASTPEGIAKYQSIGADPAFRGLVLVGYDAHDAGRTLTVVLDVEDGKRLVNQLSETITELERLPVGRE